MTRQDEPAPFRGALSAALAGLIEPEQLRTRLAPADAALPVPPATDRATWDPAGGLLDSNSARDILTRAEADLGEPWPVPLASSAARVHRDGDRDTWESTAFGRQHRLSRAVVAAATTLEDRWIDAAADGIQLLCEQSSWCWPAHDDARRRSGFVLADVTRPFVDLGAGEVAGQLAWADHLLGDALDRRYPGLRARIRHETRKRIFEPFTGRRDWHWLGLDGDVHNWNPWIHGNILTAALRLLDGPGEDSERAAVIALCLEGIDRYLTALPDDGAIDEGYAYWWNGACRALEALDLLCHATADSFAPAFALPAVRATVGFPHRMHLSGPWYVNLADAQARETAIQPWHSLHRAARRTGDADAAAFAATHLGEPLTETAGLGRLLRGLTDEAWLTAPAGTSPLPRDIWLPSVQVLLARETADTATGLTVIAKGGHNGEHHNHNDVGSFIVASDGVPVIVDAGRPTYTAATFGPDRYDIWTMQSSWHNVPEIRGIAQATGDSARATLLAVEQTAAASALTLDLTAAYPVPGLTRLRRQIALDRAARRVAVMDTWSFGGENPGAGGPGGEDPIGGGHESPGDETSLRLLVAGDVELEDGRALVIPLDGASPVIIRWPADLAARLVRRELDDPMLNEVWGAALHRIDILPAGADSVTVTIEQSPPEQSAPEQSPLEQSRPTREGAS